MDEKQLRITYDVLRNYYQQYQLSSSKERERIETSVRMYARSLPSELYLLLNEDAGNGLFRHGWFESDMCHSLRILKDLVNK